MRYIRRKFMVETFYICDKCYPLLELENAEFKAWNTIKLRFDNIGLTCDRCGKKEGEKK